MQLIGLLKGITAIINLNTLQTN